MKNIIFKLSLAFFLTSMNLAVIHALPIENTYTTDYDEDIELSRPHRSVEVGDNYVRVTYDFNDAMIPQLDKGDNALKVYGFIPEEYWNVRFSRTPRLEKTDLIRIPEGHIATLSILEASFKNYEKLMFAERSKEIVTIEQKNISLSGYDENDNQKGGSKIYYNSKTPPVNVLTKHNYRGIDILEVVVTPLPFTNTDPFKAYTKITYQVTFEKDPKYTKHDKIKQASYEYDQIFIDNFVLNKYPEFALSSSLPSNEKCDEGLLIISPPLHLAIVDEYASWKRSLGLDVQVKICDKWTLSQLKDSIAEYYYSNINPRYVLLVGDNKQIPTYSQYAYCESEWGPDTLINDNYVCSIDSREYPIASLQNYRLTDLCPGRLPFANTDEVSKVLSMIRQYELRPPTTSSFYDEATLAASFEADDEKVSPFHQASELWNFVQISENEAHFLNQNNKSVKRIYNRYIKEDPGSSEPFIPTYYSLRYPTCPSKSPTLLHTHLRNPNFNWDNDTTSFLQNMDHFLVIYNGHGFIRSLGYHKDLFKSPCSFLNGKNRPLVLSLGCLTGAYHYGDTRTVCQSMLRQDDGGAVAVYAPSHSLFVFSANHLGIVFLESIFPDKSIDYPFGRYDFKSPVSFNILKNRRLGDIINYGLATLKSATTPHIYSETYLMCNLFGDPSMIYHIDTPTHFNNAEVYRYRSKIKVIAGETGIISISNPTTGEQYTYEGSEFTHATTQNSANYQITISGQNKIPFIVEPFKTDVYTLQNIKIQSSLPINARKIYMGSNVDSGKSSGKVVIDGKLKMSAETVIIEPDTEFTINSDVTITF